MRNINSQKSNDVLIVNVVGLEEDKKLSQNEVGMTSKNPEVVKWENGSE